MVYAVSLVLIASVYIGFAVADGTLAPRPSTNSFGTSKHAAAEG